MKLYEVFRPGVIQTNTFFAIDIIEAAKRVLATLNKPQKYKYEINNKGRATIRYINNYTIIEYIIVEQQFYCRL
jgi:hypothetical protein